jgi:hypothetical protein
MHVHIQSSDGEAKFWLEPEIALAKSHGLAEHQVSQALKMVKKHERETRDAWNKHSAAEVTNISPHGFWRLVDDHELARGNRRVVCELIREHREAAMFPTPPFLPDVGPREDLASHSYRECRGSGGFLQ